MKYILLLHAPEAFYKSASKADLEQMTGAYMAYT